MEKEGGREREERISLYVYVHMDMLVNMCVYMFFGSVCACARTCTRECIFVQLCVCVSVTKGHHVPFVPSVAYFLFFYVAVRRIWCAGLSQC